MNWISWMSSLLVKLFKKLVGFILASLLFFLFVRGALCLYKVIRTVQLWSEQLTFRAPSLGSCGFTHLPLLSLASQNCH